MIRIGVIGYGYWGPNLVRNFAESDAVTACMVADLDEARLELVRRRFPGIRTTQSIAELIADPDIDAVAIATPVSTHFGIAMQVLTGGKHLWIEKPMTETADEARIVCEEAERRRLVCFVDHTFVYTGAVRRIASIVQAGDLGEPFYYDSTRINLGLFQRDVNVIADLGVHDFSILDFVMRQHPQAISATGANHFPGTPENLAYLTLYYGSGLLAHISVSWLAPVKVRQALIGGSKKMIVYDDLLPSEKVKVYDHGVHCTTDAAEIEELRVGYRTGDMWAPRLEGTEALQRATAHFAECIARGETPSTDGRLGVRVMELVEAANRSMKERGRSVPVGVKVARS